MKKQAVFGALVTVVMVSSAVSPAFANVLRSGSTGQPYAVVSNTGSAQGQANRSATGTYSKATNDGYRPVVE